jgi:RNA polymerase sigma factor (sigma-70 family)
MSAFLQELIAASDPEARSRALARIAEGAQPLIDRTLIRLCGGWLRHEEIADLRSTVLLRLMLRLQRTDAVPIAHFESFLAVLTSNAVNDYLRRRYPERTRLKNRLRYLFTNHGDFAMWNAAGIPVCGLRQWPRTDAVPAPLEQVRGELPDAAFDDRDSAAAMAAILQTIGRPVMLDDLVALVHDFRADRQLEAVDVERIADPAPTADAILEHRDALEVLWHEIQRLPRPQRAALLLNLRDADGGNALGLLVLLGVATLDAVAAAIGIATDALAAVWSRMPLDDLEIGRQLSLSRQQVINLRKAARRRLERFTKREQS